MLLEGTSPISDLEGVLSDIPPKDVADRLVSRYFNSNDPSTGTNSFPSSSDI